MSSHEVVCQTFPSRWTKKCGATRMSRTERRKGSLSPSPISLQKSFSGPPKPYLKGGKEMLCAMTSQGRSPWGRGLLLGEGLRSAPAHQPSSTGPSGSAGRVRPEKAAFWGVSMGWVFASRQRWEAKARLGEGKARLARGRRDPEAWEGRSPAAPKLARKAKSRRAQAFGPRLRVDSMLKSRQSLSLHVSIECFNKKGLSAARAPGRLGPLAARRRLVCEVSPGLLRRIPT